MSILIAFALQSSVALPPVADLVEQDIVVTASKLDRWKGKFTLRGEKFTCKTTQSSGDRAVDPIGCAAILQCLEPHRERLRQSDDAALAAPARLAMKKEVLDELGPCVGKTRKVMIAEFVAKRRAATR